MIKKCLIQSKLEGKRFGRDVGYGVSGNFAAVSYFFTLFSIKATTMPNM